MSEPAAASPAPSPAPVSYHRKNPFLAELLHREALTRPGSAKDTRHFVISLEGGPAYTPGDSLAVFARNPPDVVEELLQLLGFDPEAPTAGAGGRIASLRQVLLQDFILNRATKKLMAGVSERVLQGEQRNRLMEIVDNDDLLAEFVHSRDYVDVLREFSEARFETPAEFVALLSPIPPRLYSIASAPQVHPGEVHLCVGIVRYETHGRRKAGLCSGYLADLAPLQRREIPVYVQESRHFRLPKEASRDVIMVGPGTGIAPFRAFLEQRARDGGSGRNWLFFGEQHRATDFLYEEEFRAFQKKGTLHRLDLAFSRDQAEKTYVQHRMQEQARELWAWIQGGAYFYVCGDAHRMAKDVHQALIQVAGEQGGMSAETAAEYVNITLMKTERRYLRDIY